MFGFGSDLLEIGPTLDVDPSLIEIGRNWLGTRRSLPMLVEIGVKLVETGPMLAERAPNLTDQLTGNVLPSAFGAMLAQIGRGSDELFKHYSRIPSCRAGIWTSTLETLGSLTRSLQVCNTLARRSTKLG